MLLWSDTTDHEEHFLSNRTSGDRTPRHSGVLWIIRNETTLFFITKPSKLVFSVANLQSTQMLDPGYGDSEIKEQNFCPYFEGTPL